MGLNLKSAYDIWCSWSAILESTLDKGDFNNLRSVLIATRGYFKRKKKDAIAFYINEIILKEDEVEPGDWESIRFLLHKEWDDAQPDVDEFLKKIDRKYRKVDDVCMDVEGGINE